MQQHHGDLTSPPQPRARGTRAQAAADAAREETGRVRADADKTLAAFRAEAAAELAAVGADLRGGAEQAEAQAELAQPRIGHDDETVATPVTTRAPGRS